MMDLPAAATRPVRLDTSLELLLDHARTEDADRVLATVVATTGSTYRKPGARMLIMPDGRHVGLLSGGCLEADLQTHAREVLQTRVARALEYDMRGPDEVLFGVSAGCEGAIRVLLEPAATGSLAARALAIAAETSTRHEPSALVMVHEAADLALGTYAVGVPLPRTLIDAAMRAMANGASIAIDVESERGRVRAFVQFLAPSPHLLICGAGPDAEPVLAAAHALGWRVTIADHRVAAIERGHFAGARSVRADAEDLSSVVDLRRCHAAVVMSHVLAADSAYLRALSAEDAPNYIGLLGPRTRRERLLQQLDRGAAAALATRLHNPVGLDLGAVTPESIALAIVSEVHAWLAGRELATAAPALSATTAKHAVRRASAGRENLG
jgi:xanthine/CO dehydrogenase XdhC/CoxF family maturation factor